MRRARILCRRLLGQALRPYIMRRIAAPSEAEVAGLRFYTEPGVFHPVYFQSSRLLVEWVAGRDVAGKRFLDMGTGSGPVGIAAAARGARVTAADINPRAVALARRNAERNGVAMEVVESNVFSALGGRTFDVIAFNVPFYPREPRSHFEAAFYAGPGFETVRAFAAGCAEALASGGTVVVVFSEDSGRDGIVDIFAASGLVVVEERTMRRLLEEFYVVEMARAK
jgi:release factor glutamine methyltransferase